jgi:hypothetical protein
LVLPARLAPTPSYEPIRQAEELARRPAVTVAAVLQSGRLDYLPQREAGRPVLLTTDEERHGDRKGRMATRPEAAASSAGQETSLRRMDELMRFGAARAEW